MKTTVIFALLFASALTIRAADEFSGYIQQLAVGTPGPDAVHAMRALHDAGVAAFPTLLAHLNDRSPVHDRLSGDVSRTPTVGRLCFDIIQSQVEDNWPKGFRDFYVLTPANAQQWLADHQALSLRQLQIASREESLRRAEAELAARPTDLTTQAVAFLREEVAKLRR